MRTDLLLEEAVAELCARFAPMGDTEEVPLLKARGRVLAETQKAIFDSPPFDRSPLDGYALRAEDTRNFPCRLKVIGEEVAGAYFTGTLGRGEALRILTGAPMPEGADTVIRQEDVRVFAEGREFLPEELKERVAEESWEIEIPYALARHENYCFRGEDLPAGKLLASAGTRIGAAHIGVLAGQGIAKLSVYRRPKILLLSTGDELLQPGEPLAAGKIYNSNLYLLAARLEEMGFSPCVLGAAADTAEAVATAIRAHLPADLILTTGGVSVGKKDVMHDAIPALGAEALFWRVQLKPGAPMIAYRLGETPGIALSGNPYAALATFELVARPFLAHLARRKDLELSWKQAIAATAFEKPSHGRRFIRGRMENGKVFLAPKNASGMLFETIGANVLVDVPGGSGAIAPGDRLEVIEVWS